MKQSLLVRLTLCLVGLVAAAAAFFEMGVAQQLRASLRAAELGEAQAQADQATLAKRIDWIRRERADLEASLGRLKASHPHLRPKQESVEWRKKELAAVADPTVLNRKLNTFRSRLAVRYAAFYRAMGLSNDQIARFEDAVSKSEGRAWDIHFAGATLGFMDNSPAVQPLIADNRAQLSAELAAQFGPAVYNSYQQFTKAEPERDLVARVSSALLFTSAPLTSQQTLQLGQILAAARPAGSADGSEQIGSFNLDQVQTQAAAVLSPPQAAELASSIAHVRASEIMLQMFGMMRDWVSQAPDAR